MIQYSRGATAFTALDEPVPACRDSVLSAFGRAGVDGGAHERARITETLARVHVLCTA